MRYLKDKNIGIMSKFGVKGIKFGSLNILKWVQKNSTLDDRSIYEDAVKGGYLDILK